MPGDVGANQPGFAPESDGGIRCVDWQHRGVEACAPRDPGEAVDQERGA